MESATRGFSIRNVLHNIGSGALIGAFEAQRIDSMALCQSLTDDELKSLGLSTIGERFDFREAVQNSCKEPELEAVRSSSSIRERGIKYQDRKMIPKRSCCPTITLIAQGIYFSYLGLGGSQILPIFGMM